MKRNLDVNPLINRCCYAYASLATTPMLQQSPGERSS